MGKFMCPSCCLVSTKHLYPELKLEDDSLPYYPITCWRCGYTNRKGLNCEGRSHEAKDNLIYKIERRVEDLEEEIEMLKDYRDKLEKFLDQEKKRWNDAWSGDEDCYLEMDSIEY